MPANDAGQCDALRTGIEILTTAVNMGNQYPTRLMHVLISNLLGKAWGLYFRFGAKGSIIVFAKVLSTSTGFHYSVRDRAKELVRLLNFKRGIENFRFEHNWRIRN